MLSRKSVLDGIRSNGILLFIMKGICDDMNKKIKTPEVEQLFKGMLCLKSVEECYEFFEDICTINELLSLSQRFEVARMLREKKTYLEIAEKTGASTATISRVNRSLNYGNDGYDMVRSLIMQAVSQRCQDWTNLSVRLLISWIL